MTGCLARLNPILPGNLAITLGPFGQYQYNYAFEEIKYMAETHSDHFTIVTCLFPKQKYVVITLLRPSRFFQVILFTTRQFESAA